MSQSYKVDIVYRWVSPDTDSTELHRIRDNKELVFSLHSLKYIQNYIGNIYIISKNSEKWESSPVPITWIDEENLCVSPDSNIPQDSELCKYYIHKIPNLSEHFIIMDDDYYICKETPLDYWFTKTDNKPIWPLKVLKCHCPLPMTKKLYKECMLQIEVSSEGVALGEYNAKDLLNKSNISKLFKTRVQFDPLLVMFPYLEKHNLIEKQDRDHVLIWKTNFSKKWDIMEEVLKNRPTTLCVNDNWSTNAVKYKEEMTRYDDFRKEVCLL